MKNIIKKIMPDFLLNYYHAMWPFFGAFIYRYPSRKLKLIGITGTNGKTTSVHIASHILEKAGFKVASISSLRFKIREHEWPNKLKMTMPGRMKLQKFLHRALKAGCDYAIIEVTSEGIKQNRHLFLKFDTAVFTNLTPEHIESHGSFEKYKETKGRFFTLPHRSSVVNIDDKYGEYFLDFSAREKIAYTLVEQLEENKENINTTILAENARANVSGISFNLEGREFQLPMLGKFNIYNTLAAIGIAASQGISFEKIHEALSDFSGVSGRLEVVINDPFTVIVDYAHTPDALEKAYKAVVDLKKEGSRVIGVLGAAGGGRDKWKRPELGKLAAKYCDEIILTDEDPYSEDPASILSDIEAGFTGNINYEKIIDRRKAVAKALKKAQNNDIVIITGKGAEPLMITAKGPIDWDDRQIVKEEYNKIHD
ncbi:MAG: UDP-N-acetylmuramoyl-L-alanyl-D-glutamate--2,6-diaminopimelate ligase [Candidatus Spechtbacterales bacterium]|nr:UDP-N-acetylmuramoyl-L-alanyl-D-glutamate--2,6-diaminopimelate ligase [Candidatus Spechtbacterales bacterium]